jgi:protein disulfide-isomerase A6
MCFNNQSSFERCAVLCCVQVNADEHRSLGERFGVSGFPTIKYFARGKAVTQDNAEA